MSGTKRRVVSSTTPMLDPNPARPGRVRVAVEDGPEAVQVDLDCDLAVVTQIIGEINRSHAAVAKLALDTIPIRERRPRPNEGAGIRHRTRSIRAFRVVMNPLKPTARASHLRVRRALCGNTPLSVLVSHIRRYHGTIRPLTPPTYTRKPPTAGAMHGRGRRSTWPRSGNHSASPWRVRRWARRAEQWLRPAARRERPAG